MAKTKREKRKKTALIVIDKNKARIVNQIPSNIHDILYRGTGYMQTVSYMEADQYGIMRRRVKSVIKSKYNYLNRSFPAGMVDRCCDLLKNRGYHIKILDKRPRFEIKVEELAKRIANFPIHLRPYQIDAISTGVYNPYMVFYMATGAGKSLVLQALTHITNLKTLILVNRNDLLEQHYKTLSQNMEVDIGIIRRNQLDFDHHVCIATVQTIIAKLKTQRYKMNKYLKSVQYVISDESHHSQSKTWRRIIKLCTNAMYRHGFSGTPWDHSSDNIELEAICGKIKYKMTTSDLIRMGYLARPIITFHSYEGNEDPIESHSIPSMYEHTIVRNETRNRAIVDVAMGEYEKGAKLLLVINRIAHGEILAHEFRKRGIHDREIGYLHGKRGRVIRTSGKKEFERGNIRIMIVSQIWNEGIDIPSCDVLVKADSYGGGEIQDSEGVRNLIQQIGRVLRKPIPKGAQDVDTKTEHIVRVHDFIDKQNKYVENWTKTRYKTCKLEPEWIVKTE